MSLEFHILSLAADQYYSKFATQKHAAILAICTQK